MGAAAPGEGEAVPLQKLIGFGMVGGYLWNGWGSCPGSSIPFYRPWLGASPFVPKCCVHKVWAAISQDNHLWPDAIVFTCFLFYPLAATTLPEASSDAQDVAQAPQVETADAAEAGDALVPKQEWDPHIPTSHVHHSAGSMQQFEIFMIHIYVLDIFRLHTEDVPSAQRSHGRSCKFFLSIMRLHFPIPPRESAF